MNLCPDGWFEDNSTCLACPSTCLTCINETACLACNTSSPTPTYLRDLYQCISTQSCGEGYYIDESYGWPLCLKCESPCRTCINSSYCLTCLSGLNFMGTCKSICPSGYYSPANTPECLSCDASCVRCSVVSTNCTACNASSYLKNGSCVSSCG